MSADDDDITDELLADAGKLTGLSLELLGLDPHPDDMTPEQRLQFEPEDLAGMASVPLEARQKAVSQTLLLAGLLWNSSGDQLFRDLGTLSGLDAIVPRGCSPALRPFLTGRHGGQAHRDQCGREPRQSGAFFRTKSTTKPSCLPMWTGAATITASWPKLWWCRTLTPGLWES